ncbi:hypothetical protein AMTRI_Chr04g249360 [Amborella trichopoda]
MATATNNAHTLVADKSNPPIKNLHHFLPHKLTTEFIPILREYDLLGDVDGSLHCPAEFPPAEKNEEPKISHTFLNWKRQDQLLFSWIILALTDGIHAQIVGLTTSQETSTTTKFDPITHNNLYGMLLSQEIRHSDQHDMLDIGSPLVNLATTLNYNSRRRRGSHGQQQNNNSHFGNQQGNYPRMSCQLCNHVGHSALQCRQYFNKAFQLELDVNTNAFHATPSSINDAWYPDSEASNHITDKLSNLSLHSEYAGPEQIKIGNRTSLSIKNISSSNLITNNATFALRNILHVPSIYRNLLLVKQLTKDDDVVFEFHPSHLVVNNRSMGRAIAQVN